MAGGIIEGFQKLFAGKNILAKHSFLLILSLLIALPAAISNINTQSGQTADTYKYMYLEYPLLGLVTLVISYIWGIYFIHFVHNCIKYFVWKSTQTDEQKVNALEIMPDINGKLFSHFWEYVLMTIVWMIYIILYIAITIILGCILAASGLTALGIAACVVLLIALTFICLISMPYIFTNFAKNYEIKGNLNPLLLFTYLPKVGGTGFVLVLKYLGLGILYSIGITIIIVLITVATGIIIGLGGLNKDIIIGFFGGIPFTTAVTTVMVYLSTLLGLAFYYAVGNIYYNKIMKGENPPGEICVEKNEA